MYPSDPFKRKNSQISPWNGIYEVFQEGTKMWNPSKFQKPSKIPSSYNEEKSKYFNNAQFQNEMQKNLMIGPLMQQPLSKQICANIEGLIHQNNIVIERLQKKNQIFFKHLKNIRKFLGQDPASSRHNQHILIQQKTNDQKNVKNYFPNQKLSSYSDDLKKQESIVKEECFEGQKIRYQKKYYCPSVGPVRYSKPQWINEQRFVLKFLNGWMKKNLKATPQNPSSRIQKRIILQLYLKWKSFAGFVKTQLEPFKIQQIITNQMKVAYKCTCTLREYIGVGFTNCDEIEVSNPEETNKQSEKKDLQQKNYQKNNLEDDELDEEFSVDFQQMGIKLEDEK